MCASPYGWEIAGEDVNHNLIIERTYTPGGCRNLKLYLVNVFFLCSELSVHWPELRELTVHRLTKSLPDLALRWLTSLEILDGPALTLPGPLSRCPELRCLKLINVPVLIEDDWVSAMQIEELRLDNCRLTELPVGLQRMQSLTWLYVQNNPITSYRGLECFRNVRYLGLTLTITTDYSPQAEMQLAFGENESLPLELGVLTNLSSLYLGEQMIHDKIRDILVANGYPDLECSRSYMLRNFLRRRHAAKEAARILRLRLPVELVAHVVSYL